MLPPTHFTDAELASDHFVALRRDAASVIPSHMVAAATAQPDFDPRPHLSPDGAPLRHHAAKIWFTRTVDGILQLLSFVRSDSDPAYPQFDTFGGQMEFADRCQYHVCGLRELREEAVIPKPWYEPLGLELASYPAGHRMVTLLCRRRQWPLDPAVSEDTAGPLTHAARIQHRQALWLVRLPPDVHFRSVRATAAGATEMRPDTLLWRPASVVYDNLYKFHNMDHPIARALGELLATIDPEPRS